MTMTEWTCPRCRAINVAMACEACGLDQPTRAPAKPVEPPTVERPTSEPLTDEQEAERKRLMRELRERLVDLQHTKRAVVSTAPIGSRFTSTADLEAEKARQLERLRAWQATLGA